MPKVSFRSDPEQVSAPMGEEVTTHHLIVGSCKISLPTRLVLGYCMARTGQPALSMTPQLPVQSVVRLVAERIALRLFSCSMHRDPVVIGLYHPEWSLAARSLRCCAMKI